MPPGNELSEALQSAPNFAAATLKLYGAYRESLRKLADASRGLPATPAQGNAADWLARRDNDDLEGLAEDIWSELSPKDDIFSGLKARLRMTFGIDTRIMPVTVMGADRSRYDRHSQRLLISEALDFSTRIEEVAHLAARLAGKTLIEATVADAPFASQPEARRQARAAMFNYLCLALRCPRGRFTTSAEDLKSDIAALARRFSVSEAQAMQRLAMLSDKATYLGLEANGQFIVRSGKLPVFLPQADGLCAQLPLFDEGQGLHIAEMKPLDGDARIVLARRAHGKAHALFLTAADFAKTIYASTPKQRPWGTACRLCEIRNCERRCAASAARPAGLNDYIRGATDFEPV